MTRIGPDGFLQDVSDGTAMGPDLEFLPPDPEYPDAHTGRRWGRLFLMELDSARTTGFK